MKPGELQALTKVCSAVTGSWLLHGFQLAIETSLRRSELLGIRWHDVNFDTAVLHVPFTKTDKARTIPLTDRAVDILRERRRHPRQTLSTHFRSAPTHSGWHGNGASVAPRKPGALECGSFAFTIYGTKL